MRRLADADRREVEPPLPRLFAFPGRRLPPWCRTPPDYVFAMSQVETIEQTIRTLPMEQVRELQEWLQDYLEDLEEMRPEFVARLDSAQQQLDGAWAAWLTLFAAQGIGCDAGTRLVP